MNPKNPHYRIGSIFFKVIPPRVFYWTDNVWARSAMTDKELMNREDCMVVWPDMDETNA